MSNTPTEGETVSLTTTVVNIGPEAVRASLKQAGHLPGWVSETHNVSIAPGEGGAFVVTVEGEAPIAPAPDSSPVE